jgi:hypothetical protein
MWYAAGFWAAFSAGLLAEIIFREYIWREEGSPSAKPSGVSGEASCGVREPAQDPQVGPKQ